MAGSLRARRMAERQDDTAGAHDVSIYAKRLLSLPAAEITAEDVLGALAPCGSGDRQSVALAVSFQEVVHSVGTVNADLDKTSVIRGGPNGHPQECRL